jgi:hypothetical protein
MATDSRLALRWLALIALVAVAVCWCWQVLRPFLIVLLWAAGAGGGVRARACADHPPRQVRRPRPPTAGSRCRDQRSSKSTAGAVPVRSLQQFE